MLLSGCYMYVCVLRALDPTPHRPPNPGFWLHQTAARAPFHQASPWQLQTNKLENCLTGTKGTLAGAEEAGGRLPLKKGHTDKRARLGVHKGLFSVLKVETVPGTHWQTVHKHRGGDVCVEGLGWG